MAQGSVWHHHTIIHDWSENSANLIVTPDRAYASPRLTVAGGFSEAILSWNIEVPSGGGARLELRVARAETWSEWLFVGDWGDQPPGGARGIESALGQVDVDYFRGNSLAEALQYRITSHVEPASVQRVAMVATRPSSESLEAASARPEPLSLRVPFRNQRTERPRLAGRLCSPTCVAMAVAQIDDTATTGDVARLAHDAYHDLYGNWVRNVQAAYTLGRPGAVLRFSTWGEVEARLRRGEFVVISLSFTREEMPEAGYDTGGGHLIALRGFDDHGDVLVSDPAFGDPAKAERTYGRANLTRCWLQRTKGTAYVFDRIE